MKAWLVAILACVIGLGRVPACADEKPATAATKAISQFSFAFVDVFVDPHGVPLAAYQVEIRVTAGDVKLVGVEGGEHTAFASAPYYDPKALLSNRIVIAAFNTTAAEKLPSQKTRVARLMVQVGNEKPAYAIKLEVAASADAKPVDAHVSILEGAPQ